MSSDELKRALQAESNPRAIVDEQLRVLVANDAFCAAQGLACDEVIDRPLLELPAYSGAVQAELTRMNEHLRMALTGAKAMSWEWDVATGQGIFSQSFSSFYGIPERAFHGTGWEAAIHPDDRERLRNARPYLRPEIDWVVDLFRGVEDSSHGLRWYSMRGKVVQRANGQGLRIVGVTWDVTEYHKLIEERALLEQHVREAQRVESMGLLAGGIAHDFNNILLSILGNANLARLADGSGQSVIGHIAQIEEGASRAADLCRQLLAYAGKGRFVLAPTDLNELVQDTVHLLKVSVDRRVSLRLDLSPGLPSVVADLTQITQVLMNLVINASDASRDAGGAISISSGVLRADKRFLDNARLNGELTPGEYVFLEVADNGTGMSPETQARIFEPFFTTKFTGRGLGLSAVLGIVKGHKGALQVHSELGKGSRFTLLLPAVHEPPSKTHPLPGANTQLGRGETIMVVDDEEAVRAVTSHMIRALGFKALPAADGNEALQLYETQREAVLCVVMDLTMPHPSGIETYKALRLRAPDLKVLLMSGYSEHETDLRELSPTHTRFLQKPFKMDDLREMLRGLLRGRTKGG